MAMAPRKKVVMDDDVKKAKDKVNEGAKAVGKAADKALGHRSLQEDLFRGDVIHGKGEEDWAATVEGIDDLDKEFQAEDDLMNRLAQFGRGDVDVRVMQIGPGGTLIDVSDKVNPKDLTSDQIGGIQTGDGRSLLGRNPQSREAALRFLRDIMPGILSSEPPKNTTATSIRKMEAALAEGDKILEHWKR